jgi:hypothetical protein
LNEFAGNFEYSLEVRGSDEVICPQDCGQQGNCFSGVCTCQERFMGSTCNYAPLKVEINVPANLALLKNQMNFFSIEKTSSKVQSDGSY